MGRSRWSQSWSQSGTGLLLWMGVGTLLRFVFLGSLPPWTDECATVVFGLGNSFSTVPLDQLISSDALLEPLRLDPTRHFGDVMGQLRAESTHPPLYFGLAQLWMQTFGQSGELVSMTVARSLPAVLGMLSIPVGFGLSAIAFRSPLAAQWTAALLAVSPLNVFLAREARHYTLAVLLITVSLICFIRAIQHLQQQEKISLGLALGWIITNGLGIATHFFFGLSLMAQAIVFGVLALHQGQKDLRRLWAPSWRRLYGVALATAATALVWLPLIQEMQGHPATAWIYELDLGRRWILPPVQLLLWLLSLLIQLPSATTIGLPLWGLIGSALGLLGFLGWLIATLRRPLRNLVRGRSPEKIPTPQISAQVLGGYVLGCLGLFWLLTSGFGMDMARAPRFGFIYLVGAIAFLAALLTGDATGRPQDGIGTGQDERRFVPTRGWARLRNLLVPPFSLFILLIAGLLGSVTVITNTGYLQHHRADLITPLIIEAQQVEAQEPGRSPHAVMIASTHQHHGHTGRLMGIAWEMRRLGQPDPQFFLAHRDVPEEENYGRAIAQFTQQLRQQPRPFDLWLLNFHASLDTESLGCQRDERYRGYIGEYRYKRYRCDPGDQP